ncbi:VOC family protein [Algoriphagus resistens]|uniref:VOC family protein n=1 Tax=Algoriphagus resistens TaxID=1750590 RepID=UPI000716BD3F|nr:VOC family protein [Algoriphagus resistens]
MNSYKPESYNSLSPYLIVDKAQELIDQLKEIFDAEELRRYDRPDGSIMHTELRLDDSVIMISSSTADYPAHKTMLHMYVPDVLGTFQKAIKKGCKLIEKPVNKADDPDTRGSFYDLAGNYWSVSTQQS